MESVQESYRISPNALKSTKMIQTLEHNTFILNDTRRYTPIYDWKSREGIAYTLNISKTGSALPCHAFQTLGHEVVHTFLLAFAVPRERSERSLSPRGPSPGRCAKSQIGLFRPRFLLGCNH